MRTADSPPREPIEGGRSSVVAASTGSGDAVATIVLLVIMGVIAMSVAMFGGVMAMGASCYGDCNSVLIALGILIAAMGPLVIGVFGLVFAIVRLSQHRPAAGVPVLAMIGIAIVSVLGQGLASAGVG